jgi:glucokinase
MSIGEESPVLVFDVGGSHVSAAVCEGGDFHLGPVFSAPHPVDETSDSFVTLLHTLGVKAAAGFKAVAGAALAVPGPFDLKAGVSLMHHKLPYLYGVDLRAALSGQFGWDPGQVRFMNDADAYLMGEIGAGAARGFARAVGITLGTGVGSAFAVNGQLVGDGPGVPNGGEIWNIPFQGGIVEDFVSTRAITGDYERRTGSTSEVAALAARAKNDPVAQETFNEFGANLGRALATILSGFAPDVVVLGGGISRSAELFLPAVQPQLNGLHFQLRIAELQDRAPLVGCGVAWASLESDSVPSSLA